MITLPKVDCSRGAPMGRNERCGDASESGQIALQYVPLFDGYDEGGAYFGNGQPLILIHGEAGGVEVFRFERGSLEDVLDEMVTEYPYCSIDIGFRDNLITSGALTLFGLAYANMLEDNGTPLSGDILAQLPCPTDPAALKLATTIVDDFLATNPKLDHHNLRRQYPQLNTISMGHDLVLSAIGYDGGMLYQMPVERVRKLYDWDYSMFEGTYADNGDSDD